MWQRRMPYLFKGQSYSVIYSTIVIQEKHSLQETPILAISMNLSPSVMEIQQTLYKFCTMQHPFLLVTLYADNPYMIKYFHVNH